jgi:hypothetical protein
MAANIHKLQKLIDDGWQFASDARDACKNNTWREFQLMQMPKPFPLNFIARINYKQCLLKSIEMLRPPLLEEIKLYPVWICENEDDEPSADWHIGYISQTGNNPIVEHEDYHQLFKGSELNCNAIITVSAHRWIVGNIVKSNYYGTTIPMAMRGLFYSVLEYDVIQLDNITREEELDIVLKPVEKIPAYGYKVLPALVGFPDDLLMEIKNLGYNID